MKKFLSLLLTLAIILGLCACGGNGGAEETGGAAAQTGLQVGYAREKIMPVGSVPLSGYGNASSRLSTGVLDYLYATCIALTEGEETVLLISTDLQTTAASWTETAREQINGATGIAKDRIMIMATHTHSAPDLAGDYKEVYMAAMVKIAQAALADRAAATLYSAKVQTEGLNFVRHYEMADGTYAGDNFGSFTASTIVGHASEGDPEMVLVKMERGGDKKDILLMNYQAHPCFTGGSTKTDISADFIGTTRDAFEEATGMHFIYFTGAAGDLNATSRITEENHLLEVKEYGETLSNLAVEALENMTKIEGEGIQISQQICEYACHLDGLDRLTDAQTVSDAFKQSGNTTTGNAMAKSYGFQSVYEANGIVSRSSYPETDTMELNVLRVAGLAFVMAPCEMFSDTGVYIKENSPFDTTVILSIANAKYGYFPTAQAYDYGCYESFSARFAKGVAEDTAEQLVTMLEGLK